ncbi:MAG: Protein translocase subunit SecF [Candidatus Roizmanbacteria bacterium GW2011_GWC2_34_23]|uniref:Protein-export membrane protein SecF n=2 Tax=Candidatus Roizmaniibacteriota TaxID=1752723 RepID=A0A0G0B145_9BACT|nr:MAG: Protein translocase subunit SecF [Candidatus Roizmanbacteria bacterium GW2011_GWC2_34_23]
MINFLKYRWLYFLISFIVISAGLSSIVKWGFRYSIDFTGGSNFEFQMNKVVEKSKIQKVLDLNKISVVSLKLQDKNMILRTKVLDQNKESSLKKDLEAKLKVKITVLRSETVGPILGREAINKTLVASVLAVIGILIYMSFAFKGFNFAFSAVLAMFHDLLVVVGTYSLLGHFFGAEVDTMFVTAVLTTMSFSVHDTIVIFDKIREYRDEQETLEIESASNQALTETMIRSLNNSMTIVFMLLALTTMGGSTIRFFIITLLIGTITGTYSSPFVATPILVWLEKHKQK